MTTKPFGKIFSRIRSQIERWAKLLGKAQGNLTAAERRFYEKYVSIIDLDASEVSDTGNPMDGFVIQGPLENTNIVKSIKFLRKVYPNEKIVVSTWDNSPPNLLREIEKHYVAVVLSPLPKISGGSNRNYQLISTQAGLACAREIGISTVLKVRTDMCPMAPELFNLSRKINAQYSNGICRQRGLHGRIIVPQTYTKKYFLYHISDILMLGDINDIETYWSAETDPRLLTIEDYSWGKNSLETISNDGYLPECYFGRAFLKKMGFTPTNNLGDYWGFLRDFFIVVDDSWFDFFWFKRPNYLQPLTVDELVNHQFWQCLYESIQPNKSLYMSELMAARRAGATFSYPVMPPRLDSIGNDKI